MVAVRDQGTIGDHVPSHLISPASPRNEVLEEGLGNDIKKGAGEGDFMGASEAPGEKPQAGLVESCFREGACL